MMTFVAHSPRGRPVNPQRRSRSEADGALERLSERRSMANGNRNGGRPDGEGQRRPGASGLGRTLKVFLGQHQISDHPDDVLVTTLGSCVAACIRDPIAAIGGMNHFLLPEVPSGQQGVIDAATRYGSVAMELLINDILARGGRRSRLEVKVFGGAKVIETSLEIGLQNAQFVLEYVAREGLALAGHDLGGTEARRIHYFPASGRVLRRLLRAETLGDTVRRELQFRSVLDQQPPTGEIELFEDP